MHGLERRRLTIVHVPSSISRLFSLAVILFVTGILLFPAGLDNEVVQGDQLCGSDAGVYRLGKCTIAWAYGIIMAGTFVGLVAAVLSWTPLRWRDKDNERSFSNC